MKEVKHEERADRHRNDRRRSGSPADRSAARSCPRTTVEVRTMKVSLVDVDGHNFPNLALMRISAMAQGAGRHRRLVHADVQPTQTGYTPAKVFTIYAGLHVLRRHRSRTDPRRNRIPNNARPPSRDRNDRAGLLHLPGRYRCIRILDARMHSQVSVVHRAAQGRLNPHSRRY